MGASPCGFESHPRHQHRFEHGSPRFSEAGYDGGLSVRWNALGAVGLEADTEAARQPGAGALVTHQAPEIPQRMERFTVTAAEAHILMRNRDGSSLPADRTRDCHAVRIRRRCALP